MKTDQAMIPLELMERGDGGIETRELTLGVDVARKRDGGIYGVFLTVYNGDVIVYQATITLIQAKVLGLALTECGSLLDE